MVSYKDEESEYTISPVIFIYGGEGGKAVPKNVTHVRVHPSVKVIPEGAFKFCYQLQEVELAEGLEIIGPNAFYECTSLIRIICDRAFWMCGNLVEVENQEGLEEIGMVAFNNCKSLNEISIPSTVKVIGDAAFYKCTSIVEIELPEGLQQIGRRAFSCCQSLIRMNIPSTMKVISHGTFEKCLQLVDVRLSEGLQEIEKHAFSECASLALINIPTTVRVISEAAFSGCIQLSEIKLPGCLEAIGESAFSSYHIQGIHIPPLVSKLDMSSFEDCGGLFSLELPEKLKCLEYNKDRLSHMRFLRNVAIQPKCKLGQLAFINSEIFSCLTRGMSDLEDIFQSSENSIGIIQTLKQGFGSFIDYKLRHRFDGLPMHKICYYQSYHSTEDVVKDLKKCICVAKKQQDCLGMTPLHILACSTKQCKELYQLVIEKCPENLITEDKWGDLPITYAFWNSAPQHITQLLIESHVSLFSGYKMDWTRMVETLARANAPLVCIQNLLKTQKSMFPEYQIDWDEVVSEIFVFIECDYSFETYRAVFKLSIQERLNSLSVTTWQEAVECELDRFLDRFPCLRQSDLEMVHSKIDQYQQIERMKEAATLLELALWKMNMVECSEESCRVDSNCDNSLNRYQCRLTCGADVVLPNVLPFLLPIFYQQNAAECLLYSER